MTKNMQLYHLELKSCEMSRVY